MHIRGLLIMTALFWKRLKSSSVLVITSRQLSCLLRTKQRVRYHRGQHGAFSVTNISAGFHFEEVIYHTFCIKKKFLCGQLIMWGLLGFSLLMLSFKMRHFCTLVSINCSFGLKLVGEWWEVWKAVSLPITHNWLTQHKLQLFLVVATVSHY